MAETSDLAACMYVDKMTEHIETKMADASTARDFASKYRADFESGKSLVDITRELLAEGIATAKAVAYVESLPQGVQDEISSHIQRLLDARRTITFGYEEAPDFAVRVDEPDDATTAQITLIGPH